MLTKKIEMNIAGGLGNIFSKAWKRYSFIFVFAIILVVYIITIQANGKTFKWDHISGILSSQNTIIVGTIALGMALVIITGQIDLSIGSSLVLCSGATIMVFNMTNSIILTLLAGLVSVVQNRPKRSPCATSSIAIIASACELWPVTTRRTRGGAITLLQVSIILRQD